MFTERESAAVSEWLESGEPIHVMQDNMHHIVPLLGAGWGASLLKDDMRAWKNILNDSNTYSPRIMKGPGTFPITRLRRDCKRHKKWP